MEVTKPITNEALAKAFEILDQASELIKSNTDNPLDASAVNTDEPNADEVEKAKPFAEMLVKGGMDKDAACNVMTKGGIAMNVAQGAYASVIAAANAGKEGGEPQTLNAAEAGFSKSEVTEEITKSLTPVNAAISKGFEGMKEFMQTLATQNEELKKSNDELALRMGEWEKQPVGGRKSAVTAKAIEKFEKSNQELPIGTEAFNINSKQDLAKLVERIDAENETILQKGGQSDPLLVHCIESIEIANQVPEKAFARLRSMGIILQKEA